MTVSKKTKGDAKDGGQPFRQSMRRNHLRTKRMQAGLSQGEVGKRVGLTRQALYAIESDQYWPGTEVALRLAKVLGCSVEELFSLEVEGELIQADLVGPLPDTLNAIRVTVARVGNRLVARPVAMFGDVLNFMIPADGLIVGAVDDPKSAGSSSRVWVQLLQSRGSIDRELVVAGCDPSVFLAGEHFARRHGEAPVRNLMMGSAAALGALKRGEVHVAGLHLVDPRSGECNMPYLKRHLKKGQFTVVRFATWEQGLMVVSGNPKKIRRVEDLTRRRVRFVNREVGSGARLLVDSHLDAARLPHAQVVGYDDEVFSHLEVGRHILDGKADVGIGVRAAARLFGLDFLPWREEQYDLIMPRALLRSHPSLSRFLDALVERPFRKELDALGGYDTTEIGKVLDW